MSAERVPLRGAGLRNSEGPLASSGGAMTSLYLGEADVRDPGNAATGVTAAGGLQPSMLSSGLNDASQLSWAASGGGGGVMQPSILNPGAPTLTLSGSLAATAERRDAANDMNLSALYLHAIHDRRLASPLQSLYDDEDRRQRELWRTPATDVTPSSHDPAPFGGSGQSASSQGQAPATSSHQGHSECRQSVTSPVALVGTGVEGVSLRDASERAAADVFLMESPRDQAGSYGSTA